MGIVAGLRIALCQPNPTIGDLGANVWLLLGLAERAREAGARVALFPELAVTAYGPRDLL